MSDPLSLYQQMKEQGVDVVDPRDAEIERLRRLLRCVAGELGRENEGLVQMISEALGDRACTCHPDDSPPVPCAQKYALTECKEVEIERLRETAVIARTTEANLHDEIERLNRTCAQRTARLQIALAWIMDNHHWRHFKVDNQDAAEWVDTDGVPK